MMTKRILSGLQKAAHVSCDSAATRAEAIRRGLLEEGKTSVVPLGVHPAFSSIVNQAAEVEVESILINLCRSADTINLLHVGSTIRRKRIDVLLDVVAGLCAGDSRIRLLRVGGKLNAEQEAEALTLGLADRIVTLPFLTAEQLSIVYRRAALVLLPSDAEGFGLPVIEAMACGTPVLASDLPVLHEVGGEVAEYAPVADVAAWVSKARAMLTEKRERADLWELRRERCRVQASKFTWAETARRYREVYEMVLEKAGPSERDRSSVPSSLHD